MANNLQLNININSSGLDSTNQSFKNASQQLNSMGSALVGINQKYSPLNSNMTAFNAILGTQTMKMISQGNMTKALSNDINKLSNDSRNFGRNIQWSGQRLTYGFTVPLVAAAGVVTKFALDFDESMAGVRAAISDTVVVSDDVYNRMKETVLEMSKTSVKSATDIAGGFYELVSAGYSASDALAMLPQIVDFATASMQDTGTAAQFAARMYSAWSNTGITLSEIMDTTAIAVQKSNAHWSDFSHNMEMSAQFAKQAGLSYQELSAVIATLSDKGAVLGRLGFSISNMMQKIYAPTDKARGALEELGVQFYDDNRNMKNFGSIMTELSTKIKGYNEESQARLANEIFGIQAGRAALPILDDLAKSYGEMNDKMKDSNGTMQTMAEAIKQSPWGMYQIAVNNLNAQLITLGNIALPIVSKLISVLTGVISYAIGIWNGLSTSTQNIIIGLTLVVAAAGPFLVIIGLITEAIGLLLSPIGFAVAAILTLAAVLGSFALKGNKSFDSIKKNAVDFKDKVQSSVANVNSSMNDGAENYDKNAGKIAKATNQMEEQLENLDRQIKKTEYQFKESLAEMVRSHQDKLKDLETQLSDENTSFKDAQQEKLDSYQEKVGDLKKEDQKRLADLNQQLQKEINLGRKGDKEKIADLKARIAEETADYQEQSAKLLSEYQKDTNNAKTEHDKKISNLQTQLDSERQLLEKHSADVLSVQDFQFRDEITKLTDAHADQMKEYDRQKESIIQNAQQTTGGIADSFNDLGDKINNEALTEVGKEIGKIIGAAMGKESIWSFIDAITNFLADIGDTIKQKFGDIGKLVGIPGFDLVEYLSKKLQSLYSQGGLIGMHNGGRLKAQTGMIIPGSSAMRDRVPVMAEQGEGIMSKKAVENLLRNGTTGGGNNYSVNISINPGMMIASPGEQRELSRYLYNMAIKDLKFRQGIGV